MYRTLQPGLGGASGAFFEIWYEAVAEPCERSQRGRNAAARMAQRRAHGRHILHATVAGQGLAASMSAQPITHGLVSLVIGTTERKVNAMLITPPLRATSDRQSREHSKRTAPGSIRTGQSTPRGRDVVARREPGTHTQTRHSGATARRGDRTPHRTPLAERVSTDLPSPHSPTATAVTIAASGSGALS